MKRKKFELREGGEDEPDRVGATCVLEGMKEEECQGCKEGAVRRFPQQIPIEHEGQLPVYHSCSDMLACVDTCSAIPQCVFPLEQRASRSCCIL